jgi:hypothetical protein
MALRSSDFGLFTAYLSPKTFFWAWVWAKTALQYWLINKGFFEAG